MERCMGVYAVVTEQQRFHSILIKLQTIASPGVGTSFRLEAHKK